MRPLSLAVVLLLALLASCGLRPQPLPDGGVAPDGGSPDAGLPDAGDRWAAVRAVVSAGAEDAGVQLGLLVVDGSDAKRFEWATASFSFDTRLSIASASKMASSPVFFELIRQGKLSLSSTTGDVLGWTGPKAAITLEQLLSFTSGLHPNPVCAFSPLTTLTQCVQNIESAGLAAAPGTRFDYGASHLSVAGRMAEVVTGKSWNQLFTELVGAPLGFGPDAKYYAAPRTEAGQLNPLVSGGLRVTTNEYLRLAQLIFHQGTLGPVTLGTPALYEAQAREPFPSVVVGNSPMQSVGLPYRYGLSAWLECATPATGCRVVSSPGAFGFTPWFDRDSGYVAILGMELSSGDVSTGVVSFAVTLEQRLQPLIRDALAP